MIDMNKLLVADGSRFDPNLYEVVLRPLSSAEGGGWLATIPALPGCMGDGQTELKAIEDARQAALEWADAAVTQGDPIPAPDRSSRVAAE